MQSKESHTTQYNQKNITFESLLTKRIYDDVHGFVSLTEDEKKLLSNPYMRRLHFIKQNALANFIFPGATHTRFSHSVGVLYIVEKMIQKLKTLPKEKINITPIDHQIVRLAALLHDVGHYPLSHTIEDCFKKYDQYFLQNKKGMNPETGEPNKQDRNFFETIRNKKDFLKDFPQEAYKSSDFHHENIAKELISCPDSPIHELIYDILRKLYRKFYNKSLPKKKAEAYLELMGDMIKGKTCIYENDILKDKKEKDKYFILSLLINSDLDADQMDYMLRDTKNTGIETTIRTDFLIDNLNICYIKVGKETQPVLCFNYKALESIQQFILSKAYWYTEIIYHEKSFILNRIAKRLYMYALNKYDNISSFDSFKEKILFNKDIYIKFTDYDFWEHIYKLKEDSRTPKIMLELINILLGKSDIPNPLSNNELQDIINESNRRYFMNDIRTSQITHDKKKKIYDSINEIFQKRYNDRSKFPMYLSNKIFKPTHGEKEADLYTNRSIYILKNKCKNECNMDCLSATELLNPKLGLNIIHKILNVNNTDDDRIEAQNLQAYVEKCIVYNLG